MLLSLLNLRLVMVAKIHYSVGLSYQVPYLGYDEVIDCYMSDVLMDADTGSYSIGDEYNLEKQFPGLRYKQFEGLSFYGEPKGVYSEDWVEEDGSDVYISPLDVREQTEPKLTLYFFDPDGSDDTITAYSGMYAVYEEFMSLVSSSLLIYRDTVRQRRLLLYLSSSTEPSVDSVNGLVYLQVVFKFKNVFGRSFSLDDMTIADYLGIDSYPVCADY